MQFLEEITSHNFRKINERYSLKAVTAVQSLWDIIRIKRKQNFVLLKPLFSNAVVVFSYLIKFYTQLTKNKYFRQKKAEVFQLPIICFFRLLFTDLSLLLLMAHAYDMRNFNRPCGQMCCIEICPDKTFLFLTYSLK